MTKLHLSSILFLCYLNVEAQIHQNTPYEQKRKMNIKLKRIPLFYLLLIYSMKTKLK